MKTSTPLAFALLLLGLACTSARAEAPQATEVRKVDAFTALDLAGTLAVEARIGQTARVEVRGDADLVKLVTTSVKRGVLVIGTPKGVPGNLHRPHAKLAVVITAPALDRVILSGTGSIDVTGLAAPAFDASIPGTGSLQLAGSAATFRLTIAGTGEVKAKGLVTETTTLLVPGTADAKLHATQRFDAAVSGTAMVRVAGKPAVVNKQVTGTAMIDVR